MPSKTKSKRDIVKDKFLAFLNATSLAKNLDRDHVHLGHSYGHNLLLLGWSHQPYMEAIKAVQEIYPDVSDKTIGKVLTQSVIKLFYRHNVRENADPDVDAPEFDSILNTLDPSVVNQEIDNLLELLKSQINKWTAFVFLEGIELKNLVELPLGVATLYPKDHGPLNKSINEIKTLNGFEDVPKYIDESTTHCSCYLTVDIEGESDYVAQQALRQAQEIVSVLNLYTTSSRHRASLFERIGVLGQPTILQNQLALRRTPPISEEANPPGYSFTRTFPPAHRYKISSTQVRQWRKHGLNKVLECMEPNEIHPDTAEWRIHNAIIWYGRAMNAISEDEQFVGLIIALESLLGISEQIKITQRLADGVSALIGTNLKNREDISKKIKELYNLRGRLVHNGISISQRDLFILDELVANTIIAFVQKEIATE